MQRLALAVETSRGRKSLIKFFQPVQLFRTMPNGKQPLALDEIALSYDEWEEVRTVRTVAVLKLTRFTRQVVSVTSGGQNKGVVTATQDRSRFTGSR